jgi:HSP20 family molecular chaperone IbpA
MPEMTSAVGDLLHPRHKFLEETPHNIPAFVQYLTDGISSFQSQHKSQSSPQEAFTPRFDVTETRDAYFLAGEFAGLSDKSALSIEWGGDGRTLIIDGHIPRFNPQDEWQNTSQSSNAGGFNGNATQSGNTNGPAGADMAMEERERAQEEGRVGKPNQGMQTQSQVPMQQDSGQQGRLDANGHQQDMPAQQQAPVQPESGHQSRFDKLVHGRQPETSAQPQRPMQPDSRQNGQNGQSGQSRQYDQSGQSGHQGRFEKHGRPRVWLSERHTGEFTRSFTFPSRIEADGLRARLSDGLLRVVVPKGREEEHRRSRHIAIE